MNHNPANPDYQTAQVALENAQKLLHAAFTARLQAIFDYEKALVMARDTAAWAVPVIESRKEPSTSLISQTVAEQI